MGDTAAITDAGETVGYTRGLTLLIFDSVKLALYSIYYAKQQLNDIAFFLKNYHRASFGDFFSVIWNLTISTLNITNFALFLLLSEGYDVNEILRGNAFLDSYTLMTYYWWAQLFDSMLVLMNMFNII